MNIYNHHDTFLPCKYQRWYYSIIERAICQDRKKDSFLYFEVHHILPKSIFPEYRKEKWNLVLLTAKEHFICHWLLIKMLSGINKSKMYKALHRMSQTKDGRRLLTSMEYEIVRKYNQKFMREYNPSNNPQTKEKKTLTNIKKYGGPAPACSEIVRNKMKATKLEQYGKECYNNIEKAKETNLTKYGVEYPFQSPEIVSRIKDIHNEKYGCHFTQTEEYRIKRKRNAKEKQNRKIVLDIKSFCKANKVTLTRGWWQKSDSDLETIYKEIGGD